MVVLLEKIRQINHLVQNSMEVDEDYSPLAKTLSSAMGANAYIIGRDGVVLGHGLAGAPDCSQADFEGEIEVTPEFRHQLDLLRQSALNQKIEKCIFHKSGCKAQPRTALSALICNGKERLGHLVFTRDDQFQEDEMILAEVGALAIGLVMVRHQSERSEADARQKANVQVALSSLSFSEMQAISCVFNELDGVEGFLVASKIADRIGITRSVIVNAMRKLESAGIVESRSLGMKGTYIKVQNRFFLDELAKRAKAK